MAYEKKALAGIIPAHIIFYYKVDDLKDLGEMWTAYMSSHKVSEEVDAVDLIALSEDEADIFLDLLKSAALTADVFHRFSLDIPEAYGVNVDFTPNGGEAGKYVVFKTTDYQNYNDNILPVVDRNFEDTMKHWLLRSWLAMKEQDVTMSDALHTAARRALLRSSVLLKKVAISI